MTLQQAEAMCLLVRKQVFDATMNGREPNITQVPEEDRLVKREDGITLRLDVRYDSVYPNNFCDIWYAGYEDGVKRPTIFSFHGGGFLFGDKQSGDPLAVKAEGGYNEEIVKAGYNIVECNYCFAPEYRFPAQIEQVNEVIAYFLNHPEYGLDMSRIVVTGGSAGACFTEIYGLAVADPSYAERLGIHPAITMKELCCVVVNEACLQTSVNTSADNMYALQANWFGEESLEEGEKAQLAEVSRHIHGLYPPAYLVASNNEPFFSADVRAMDEALTRYGLAHEIYDEPKEREVLPHGFVGNFAASPCAKECFEGILAFLRKYTK